MALPLCHSPGCQFWCIPGYYAAIPVVDLIRFASGHSTQVAQKLPWLFSGWQGLDAGRRTATTSSRHYTQLPPVLPKFSDLAMSNSGAPQFAIFPTIAIVTRRQPDATHHG